MRARLHFDTRRVLGRADIVVLGLQDGLLSRFPVNYLRRNRVLPLRLDESEARLELVINEPDRVQLIEEVLRMAGARCALVRRAAAGVIEGILEDSERLAGPAVAEATADVEVATTEPALDSAPAATLSKAVVAVARPTPDAGRGQSRDAHASPTTRQRVLVVESEPRLRNAIGTLFEHDGHRVTVTEGLSSLDGSLAGQAFDLTVVRSAQVEDPRALASLLRARSPQAELNVTASYSQQLRGEPVAYDATARFWFGFADVLLGMLEEALPHAPRGDRRVLGFATLVAQHLGLGRKTVDTVRLALVIEQLAAVQVQVTASAGAERVEPGEAERRVVETLMRGMRCPYEVLPLLDAARGGEAAVGAAPVPIEAQVLIVTKRYAVHRAAGGTLGDFEATLREGAGGRYDARVAETLLSVLKGDRLLARLERGKRVVIADATADDTATLALRFRNEGFDVELCRDGQAALDAIRRDPPHLVLAEIVLPRIDGFGLLTSLRTDPRLASIPFVFVSSRTEASVVARALRLGAEDHVPKPVDPDVLLIKVNRLLSSANPSNPGSISGDLSEISLVDLLQLVSEAAKTVRIDVRGTERSGEIFLRGGALVHARCGARSGSDAFLSLVPLTEGRFTVQAGQEAPEDSIEQPLEMLILEGIRVST